MDGEKEEKNQLLEDASTLLMFASAAAKYQQQQIKKETPSPRQTSANDERYGSSVPLSYRSDINSFPSPHYTTHMPPLQASPQFHQTVGIPHNPTTFYNTQKHLVSEEKFRDGYDTTYPNNGTPTNSLAPILASDGANPSIVNPEGKQNLERTTKDTETVGGLPLPGFQEVSKVRRSPTHEQGHPNVAFTRGIDASSGKRNTDNAIIAAAALAAAADIPLPLLQRPLGESTANASISTDEQGKMKQEELTIPSEAPELKSANDKKYQRQTPELNDVSIIGDGSLHERKETENSLEEKPRTADFTSDNNIGDKVEPKISRDEVHDNQRETAFVVPPIDSYKVKPESGIIGCICGIEDDDGFTIQCDICYRWQHCLCMGYSTNEEIPDEYKCYFCDPEKWGRFDPETCRQTTLKRLELERAREVEAKRTQKRRSQSSDQRHDDKRKKKKEKSELFSSHERKVSRDSSQQNNKNDKKMEVTPNSKNEYLEEGVTSEVYQALYCSSKDNLIIEEELKNNLNKLGDTLKSHISTSGSNEFGVKVITMEDFRNIRLSRIVRPNLEDFHKRMHQIGKNRNFNNTAIQVKVYHENLKQKFNGISKLGVFICGGNNGTEGRTEIPQNTPIIEYTGELKSFKTYIEKATNQYNIWGCTKPHVLRTSQRNRNDAERELDVVIDSRSFGNESRFIRRSCPSASNCIVEKYYIQDERCFRFLIVTSKPIVLDSSQREEELRLPWNWDENQPINKLYTDDLTSAGVKFEQLSSAEKSILIDSVDNILSFVECGCNTSSRNEEQMDCAIFKVKKATSHLLRSTRKVSSISNVNLSKTREDLINRPVKTLVPWNEKLLLRDNNIQIDLHVLKVNENTVNTANEKQKDSKKEMETSSLNAVPASSALYLKEPLKNCILSRYRKMVLDVSKEERHIKSPSALSEIPIDLIPELMQKIRDDVDAKLRQLRKNTSHTNFGELLVKSQVPIEVASGNTNIVEKDPKLNNSTEEGERKEVSNTLPSAPVKKLSFADYKRKKK